MTTLDVIAVFVLCCAIALAYIAGVASWFKARAGRKEEK